MSNSIGIIRFACVLNSLNSDKLMSKFATFVSLNCLGILQLVSLFMNAVRTEIKMLQLKTSLPRFEASYVICIPDVYIRDSIYDTVHMMTHNNCSLRCLTRIDIKPRQPRPNVIIRSQHKLSGK
jgi:hypothetical protein